MYSLVKGPFKCVGLFVHVPNISGIFKTTVVFREIKIACEWFLESVWMHLKVEKVF